MSILGSIFSKVFGHHAASAPAGPDTVPVSPATPASDTTAPSPVPGAPSAPPSPAPGAAATHQVDVAAMLDGLAQKSGQTFDWRHSIVDMMKLLDLDSSLTSRQTLAHELHYSGDMHDSASMNVWLHQQVMMKLAQNGGKVPDDLK